jgi:multidrug resistance efflux pump
MDILGTSLFAAGSAIVAWGGAMWRYRDKKIERKEDQADRLKIHSDDLLFKLLTLAREEIASARLELGEAKAEVRALRPLEQDFYHVQQALDHIDVLLYGPPAAHKSAERNAAAFVKRIRRLHEARGTISNEVQRADSAINLAERSIDKGTEKPNG